LSVGAIEWLELFLPNAIVTAVAGIAARVCASLPPSNVSFILVRRRAPSTLTTLQC